MADYLNVTVGHAPVAYRRYGKRATVKSYKRTFMVIPEDKRADFPNIAEAHTLEAATAECRAWCIDRIARHRDGSDPVRYIHVTMPDKTAHQWTPARGWVTK